MSKCRFEFPGIYQAPPFEPWSFGPYPNCGGTWIMALSPSRIWSTPRVQPSMRFLPGWKAKGFPSPPFSRRVDQPEGVRLPSLPSMERVTIALYIFVLVTGGLPGALFVISTRTSVIFSSYSLSNTQRMKKVVTPCQNFYADPEDRRPSY